MLIKKFKVWNKVWGTILPAHSVTFNQEGVMTGVVAIVECTDGSISLEDFSDFILEEEEVVLLQDTGLLDKNNNPIYEGDILSYSIFQDRECPRILKVDDLFKTWHDDYGVCHGYKFGDLVEFFEIIGNIYENPELLENN